MLSVGKLFYFFIMVTHETHLTYHIMLLLYYQSWDINLSYTSIIHQLLEILNFMFSAPSMMPRILKMLNNYLLSAMLNTKSQSYKNSKKKKKLTITRHWGGERDEQAKPRRFLEQWKHSLFHHNDRYISLHIYPDPLNV